MDTIRDLTQKEQAQVDQCVQYWRAWFKAVRDCEATPEKEAIVRQQATEMAIKLGDEAPPLEPSTIWRRLNDKVKEWFGN